MKILTDLIRRYPFAALLAAIMMQASNSTWAKLLYEEMPPIFYLAYRFTITGILLLLIAYWSGVLHVPREHRKKLFVTFLLAIPTTYGFFIGVSLTQVVNASLLFLMNPVLIYIFSVVFLKEPASKRALAGALVALMGGILLVGAPVLGDASTNELFGNLLVFCSTLAYSALITYSKSLLNSISPEVMAGSRGLFIGLVGVAVLIVMNDWSFVPEISGAGWSLLTLVAVVTSGLGNFLLFTSMKYMRAEDTSAAFYLHPLIGSTLGVLVLGELMGPLAFLAGMIIVFGIIVSHPVHVNRMRYYQVPQHGRFQQFKDWLGTAYNDVRKLIRHTH